METMYLHLQVQVAKQLSRTKVHRGHRRGEKEVPSCLRSVDYP